MAVSARRVVVFCSALCALLNALVPLTGCGDSHGGTAAPPAMQRADATAGAPAERPVNADGPVTCDPDSFPPLPPGCPAPLTAAFGHVCTLPSGTTCRYLFGDGSKTTDTVAVLSCNVADGRTTWSGSSAPCRHDCSISADASRSIDASTCARRALEPCVLATTVQAQVDAMLREIMSAPEAPPLGLNEDSLFVEFENGCPTRLKTRFSHGLDGVEPLLETLSHVRWACAVEFTCAQFEGPSTLAAP